MSTRKRTSKQNLSSHPLSTLFLAPAKEMHQRLPRTQLEPNQNSWQHLASQFSQFMLVILLCTTRNLFSHLGMLSYFEYRVVAFSLEQVLLQLYTCNRPLLGTHLFSSRLRTEKMSVTYLGGKAWWLSSNPRGSVLELVESERTSRRIWSD